MPPFCRQKAYNKMENNIDVSKYGFEFYNVSEFGIKFYRRQFETFFVELMVAENSYTLSIWHGDDETIFANRYEVETQKELDFIILRGRVGSWFNM
jgi:hypothetical protein